MAGEDFAFFGRAVPAAFLFLGIRNESAGSVHNLHSPRWAPAHSLPAGAGPARMLWAPALLASVWCSHERRCRARRFTMDESALHIGAALHASLAMEYLAQQRPAKSEL